MRPTRSRSWWSCPSPPLDLDWKQHVVIDERFIRPAEVDLLVGDPSKAEKTLGWHRDVEFAELVPDDGGGRPGAGQEPDGLSRVPMAGAGGDPRRPPRPAGGLRRRDALLPLPVRPALGARPTSRWCRACRRPSSARCAPPPDRHPRRWRWAPAVRRAQRRRSSPPTPVTSLWHRAPSRADAGRAPPGAGPAAPRDPGLHRRLHRDLHHPRRLGVGARPAVPHQPACPRDRLGHPHRGVRRAAGGRGRRCAAPRHALGRAPLRGPALGARGRGPRR